MYSETRNDIEELIKKFIVDNSYIEPEVINNDTLIFEENIMDSMGFISLITFLDESFDVKPDDSELIDENFESISAIVKFVMTNLVTSH